MGTKQRILDKVKRRVTNVVGLELSDRSRPRIRGDGSRLARREDEDGGLGLALAARCLRYAASASTLVQEAAASTQ